MQRRADAGLPQLSQHGVASRHAYNVQVPDMLVSRKGHGQCNSVEAGEQLVIAPCGLPSRLVPIGQIFQLRTEHHCLYRIEPGVEAYARMKMFSFATVIAQSANCCGNLIRISQYGAAVTVPAEILAWVETRSSRQSYACYALFVAAGAV